MPVADITGSMMALAGILMALVRRQTTGQGDYLDISMHDSTISWLPNATGPVFAEGRAPRVKEERSWGGHSFYNIYETADARHIVLAGVEHKFIRNLLSLFGRADMIEEAARPPGPAHAPVKAFLQSVFLTRTRDEWARWAEDKDVCLAPVLDLHEAFHHPQLEARQMLIRDEAGQLHIGNPIRFRDEPATIDTRLPAYGEHTAQILSELSERGSQASAGEGA
jgi:crotonobetainyl-CoA:carnitine CoA-transferase CaiB-like acyl-CoA transferase